MAIEPSRLYPPALLLAGIVLGSMSGCGGGVKTAQNAAAPSPIPAASPTPVPAPGASPTATPPPGTAIEQPKLLASAVPGNIQPGEASLLFWTTEDASAISVDGIGTFPGPEGSVTVSPAATTTYNVTATGPGGSTQVSLTVEVAPATASARRVKSHR